MFSKWPACIFALLLSLSSPIKAEFNAAYKEYAAGNKGALIADFRQTAASRDVPKLEAWWDAFWRRFGEEPPSFRGIDSADAAAILRLSARVYFDSNNSERLLVIMTMQRHLKLARDVESTLELAAKLNNVDAIKQLAPIYREQGRIAEYLSMHEQAAKLGDRDSLRDVACSYFGALTLNNKARNYGFPEAVASVPSRCTEFGRTEAEPATAFRWIRLAVDQATAAGQAQGGGLNTALAWLYFLGLGTKQDKAEAFKLFSSVVADDELTRPGCLGSAGLGMALLYEDGAQGVPKDPERAAMFRKRTAPPGLSCGSVVR